MGVVSALEEPVPAEMFVADAPLSDADLDAYLAWADEHAWDEDEPGSDPLAEVDENPAAYRDDLVAALPVYRWAIADLNDAEWAMSTLATARDQVRVLAEQRDEWMRSAQSRIDRWYQRASRRPARTAAVMAAKLERYGLEQRAADPKCKSVPLPSGVIKTTEAKPKAKVLEDDMVAAIINRGLLAGVDGPWYQALHDAEVKMDDLIVESTKVYVGPFRKIVTVAEVPTGVVTVVVDLSCEHVVSDEFGADEDPDEHVPALGSSLVCATCAPDPIEGPPERVGDRGPAHPADAVAGARP